MTGTVAGVGARGGKDEKSGPLSTDDWVKAAEDLLASENVRGVQISALCLKLKVTKGSFYWHFSSRDDLLRGVLNDWRRRMTLNIVTRLTRAAGDAASILRGLLALPRKAFSARGAAIEMSIRDWGRRDAVPRQTLKEVDLIRLSFFEQTFRGFGFSAQDAKLRGYVAYAIMMGDSILKETMSEEISTEDFVELAVDLLSRPERAQVACR
jgi:AcrR family transcriptional regulator